MKTKLMSVCVAVAALVGLIPASARAQGNVQFTSLDQATFTSLESTAAWVGTLDFGGNSVQLGPNSSPLSLSGATSANAFLTVSGGVITLKGMINHGGGGDVLAGSNTSVSLNSVLDFSGIAIGVFSPNEPTDPNNTLIANNLIITPISGSPSSSPSVADTSTSTFGGLLGTFSSNGSDFNMSLDESSGAGNQSRIVILGLSPEAVPEPSSLALAALGGMALFAATKLLRRSVGN